MRQGARGARPDGARAAAGPPVLTATGWLAGLATTAAVVGSNSLAFGIHSPSAHLVLDTVDACVAALVTFLVWGRYRRSGRWQDLLLAQGMLVLAAAAPVSRALEALLAPEPGERLGVWVALVMRATAAALVVCAALRGPTRVVLPRGRRLAGVPLLLLAAAVALLWWLRDGLPVPLPQDPPASAADPVITGHPLLLTAQLFGALAFGLASIAFAGHARRRGDALLLWLGPACALGACARLSYFLFPSLYSDWLYTGDLLRTASYAVLLVGAAREISEHWTARAEAMVLDDRRRLARELHDGVVQELGYLRARLPAVVAEPDREELLASCDRAMDEARAAVDALGRSPEEPLGFVLHRAARQVADRYGGRVVVDLDDSVQVDQAGRHALVRITREAVSNALRHGRAASVHLRLERDADGVRLVVQDDGRGFDTAAVGRSTGYGLTSMRERALALPATFAVESAEGAGTAITVTWHDGSTVRVPQARRHEVR